MEKRGFLMLAMITLCASMVVAQGRRSPLGLDACKLLDEAAKRANPQMSHEASQRSPGSNWESCEYTDVAAGSNLLERKFSMSFGFVPYTSLTEAQQDWQKTYDKWLGHKGESASSSSSVSRLRGFGADDAFVVETTNRDPEPGSQDAFAYWRKGRWMGTLNLHAPKPNIEADVGYVQAMLKAMNWAAFAK